MKSDRCAEDEIEEMKSAQDDDVLRDDSEGTQRDHVFEISESPSIFGEKGICDATKMYSFQDA